METLLFGALLVILFVFSFFAFAKAVRIAGTALAAVSSRLSVIIPIVLSIFFFHEIPTVRHYIGFLFTMTTIARHFGVSLHQYGCHSSDGPGAAVIWNEKLNRYGRQALVTGPIAILLFGI